LDTGNITTENYTPGLPEELPVDSVVQIDVSQFSPDPEMAEVKSLKAGWIKVLPSGEVVATRDSDKTAKIAGILALTADNKRHARIYFEGIANYSSGGSQPPERVRVTVRAPFLHTLRVQVRPFRE
jgi:hypothetical protein